MFDYWVDVSTGKFFTIFSPPAPPAPPGYAIVSVDPSDRRMTWDFVNLVWYWEIPDLLNASHDIYFSRMNALFTVGSGNGVALTAQYVALYATACQEDPTDSRTFTSDGLYFVAKTNAQIKTELETYFDTFQETFTVGGQVAADINNGVITDISGIGPAWIAYSASYTYSRTPLASYSDLIAAFDILSATVSNLPAPGMGPDGKSAYQVALDGGFVGTSSAWLLSLKGANGTNGTNGTAGTNGTNGSDATTKAYVGTTVKAAPFPIFKSVAVASGTATFHLTDDGLSTGNALFANEVFADSVQVCVSDAAAAYQMSWVFTNSNKTLTVTANKLTTSNILTGILGQAQANAAVVKLTVWGR